MDSQQTREFIDTQTTKEFIDDIYATINISHAWIVYDGERDNQQEVLSLIEWLRGENYPLCVIDDTNASYIKTLEHAYRMFIIDQKDISNVHEAKQHDLSNVSVILCTTSEVVTNVSRQLTNYDIEKLICMC
jgi:hypothetical protein